MALHDHKLITADYSCDEAIQRAKQHVAAAVKQLQATGHELAAIDAAKAWDNLNVALGQVVRARVAEEDV